MSEQAEDLAVLKERIARKKVDCFEYMEALSRMNETMLGHCGHKDLGAALKYALGSAQKEISKLINEHLKKYPD